MFLFTMLLCFNPTLVRLRGSSPGVLGIWNMSGFNPTLVRLRGSPEAVVRQAVQRFNPTLVRLRAHPGAACLLVCAPFQSHAGSIEGWGEIVKAFIRHRVSIPRWFD